MTIENARNKVVSRAENKLADFCEFISYDFRGKRVLDIGSSTGGFTEYALKRGAVQVIAVEKGTRQMKAPLRFNPKVELHEKTDIFNVVATESAFREPASGKPSDFGEANLVAFSDVILADVSFVSLTKVLAYAKMRLARLDTDFLVMLKPQFEAFAEELNKGVVKNEKIRRGIIKRFENWLKQNGFLVIKKRDNNVMGKNGNIERFYYLKIAKA